MTAAWRRDAVAIAPFALATALVSERTISAILDKLGHPGAALDDAYIHFQYARAFAEGHPLRFQAGDPMTSGATSVLWPALLAPFWAAGFRDEFLLWPAWVLSFAALGALSWEVSRLTERLAGRAAAVGAGAMTLAFGGLVWSAASGMEGVPFAWAIARSTRRASEWAEAEAGTRTRAWTAELVALAWVSALLRPEGAVTALFVAGTIAAFPPGSRLLCRAPALGAVAAAVALPLLLFAVTGSFRSSTAVAKLLPGNPYYPGAALTAAVGAQMKTLVTDVLDGGAWSAEFLPPGGSYFAMSGLAAVGLLGWLGKRPWRAAGVLLLALTMFAPCFYATFLWNRLRYLWPFAPGFFVGLGCLAHVLGELASWVRPRWRVATPLLCGAFVGLFASRLQWVLLDLAQSASGIDRQQVALGRWARDQLPRSARIGVNDTGAIAYFSDRRTFDVVGLTTDGEAKYWVAGPGSRFEHYERLRFSAPDRLPTHFIVYAEWMAIPWVLGEPLEGATVTDATILGGQTMRAYVADWSLLGSGEMPWTRGPAMAPSAVVDTVDVADLESEAEHGYELLGAREGENVAQGGDSPVGGSTVVDGGRAHRSVERFLAHLAPGRSAGGIVRLEGPAGTVATVRARGRLLGRFDAGEGRGWVERTFDIPDDVAGERTAIEVRFAGGLATVYHYWFFTTPGG